LCHFLDINKHSDYLTLLDNCGYGASITTKKCAAQLAEVVGKEIIFLVLRNTELQWPLNGGICDTNIE
jgi:hypothetical protein